MRIVLQITLLLIFALALRQGIAQTFPVRVTPILTPPYTPFLTDYTDAGAERLTLQVMLNDLTVAEFRTKLRLTIEGVGITITTNPNYFPPPISLQGGVPQLIYGSDIADYFKMPNLVFQGLNPNEVQKNGGRLPEGIYRFSFEVLDYNRNTVVSNKGFATAWMVLNDPPFINLPVNNAKIKPLNPQNIVFQWTPRHRGSPNAAFTTDYDVKLVEIWPAGRNPFDAINTSRPIFETTTSAMLLVYGPAETPLVLGREYALQVRARDNGGRDVFKNNGYSEVIRFVYGDECPLPTALNADDINIAKARMRWQGSGQNSDYQVRYREKKEGARWFENRTEQSYFNATGLRPGTTYEYQVRGQCDNYQSEYATTQSFTTLAENPNEFVCADPNSVPPPDGSPALPALFTNDFIHAGGFDVVVTRATGANGRFTGEGLAVVPWFNSAKVRVTFENIGVNTSYQLTGGEIKSLWDPNSRSMFVDEKTIAETGGPSGQFNSDIQTFEPDTAIVVTGVILSAYNDPDGNTVLETNEGRTVLPKGTSYAIADEAGNGYIVDKEGNIKKTTAADALAAGAKANREYSTDPNSKVNFIKAGNTKYGFDEPQTVLAQNYLQTEAGDKVAWKALAAGLTDNIVAASQGVGDIGKATFKLEPNSQALNPTIAGTGQVSLTLTGGGDGVVNELLAYYPNPDTTKTDLVAGKLNVVSYDLVKKNLVLVRVNGTTTSLSSNSLQTELNNIYSQGVVQWTVNSTQSINVNGIDENALDDGGSGLLSNYTEDMKKILRAYTADHAMASDTYYLFLVKNATSQSKLGYMPRKKQAGFIFVDAHNNADIVKTIAHELGHGAFHLKHTFSEYPFLSQGVTENLMDYPAKTRLAKWQWDHIHNPEGVLGLFEGDDEGALVEDVAFSAKKLKDLIEGYRLSKKNGMSSFVINSDDFYNVNPINYPISGISSLQVGLIDNRLNDDFEAEVSANYTFENVMAQKEIEGTMFESSTIFRLGKPNSTFMDPSKFILYCYNAQVARGLDSQILLRDYLHGKYDYDLIRTMINKIMESHDKGEERINLNGDLAGMQIYALNVDFGDKGAYDLYISRSGNLSEDLSSFYNYTKTEMTEVLGFKGEFTQYRIYCASGGTTSITLPTSQSKSFEDNVLLLQMPSIGRDHIDLVKAIRTAKLNGFDNLDITKYGSKGGVSPIFEIDHEGQKLKLMISYPSLADKKNEIGLHDRPALATVSGNIEMAREGEYQIYEFHNNKGTGSVHNTRIFVLTSQRDLFESYLLIEQEVLITGINWRSQVDSYFENEDCYDTDDGNVCCRKACDVIIEQFGVKTNRGHSKDIAVLTSPDTDYNSLSVTNDFESGLEYLKSTIKPNQQGGKPVLVGVHYNRGKKPFNTNKATYHFIVIVGKGYDRQAGKHYFRFYDVNTSNRSEATSENNKLYIEETQRLIRGASGNGRSYTITEVRQNF